MPDSLRDFRNLKNAPTIGPGDTITIIINGREFVIDWATLKSEMTLEGLAAANTAGVPAVPVEGEIVAEEFGDEMSHVTKLTLTDVLVGLSGDDEALSFGVKVYEFPVGDIMVLGGSMSLSLLLDDAVQSDTPLVGLGVAEATAAAANFSAAELCDNYIRGIVASSVDGTGDSVQGAGQAQRTVVTLATDISEPVFVAALSGNHNVHLNVAATWADLTAPAALHASGEIVIRWIAINTDTE